jgi:XTP/dITP diphosphohydrolase
MLNRILVLATHNRGKITEFRELLSGFSVELKSLQDFGPIPTVAEDGETFEENAYKKASTTARILGFPVLADDSGLEVEALGGLPGVCSSRYAGEEATDEENILKLLEAMKGMVNRRASFKCVISIAVPRGIALTYEEACDGEITHQMIGNQGFGYDPIFYYPPLKKTFAQMSIEEKNRISHRGKAASQLRDEFDKVLLWLEQRLNKEPI